MSERQVKKDKKNAGEIRVKAPVDKSAILANVIVTIVILAVLGLGVYAVGSKYMENRAAQGNQQTEQEQPTVADFIAEKGITFEEFKTEYGLEGDEEVTEESIMGAVAAKFTLENYAKYTDTTLEELKTQYGLGDDVPNTTTWQDAMSYMTTGVIAQNFFGMDFETFKTQMGMPDSITADTLWSETEAVMSEIAAQQAAESDAVAESESGTDAAEDGSASTDDAGVNEGE